MKGYRPNLVKDIIIGMSDGLTVPFALTAGLSGVLNTSHLVIVSGLAEIAAGCISMGLGGYLAGQSETENYDHELKREIKAIQNAPQRELEEAAEIFVKLGVDENLGKKVAFQIGIDKKRLAEFLLKIDLEIEKPAMNRAGRSAITIAFSYLVGGFIPLFPYLVSDNTSKGLFFSCILTVLALIVFGYFKSKMTSQPVIKGTFKVVLIGIIAASAAYWLAKAVS